MNVQHKPGQRCVECEGFCLRVATVDEANTALAVAGSLEERIFAAEALQEAAGIMVANLMRVRKEATK